MNETKYQKQMFCTFATIADYQRVVENIKKQIDLSSNKVFVFCNQKNENEVYLTYITLVNKKNIRFKSTINIHRKKQTNTLYTLNAMNKLIADENNGVFDKTYQLNWQLFSDCIILTNDVGVKVVPLKLVNIISK